MAYEQILSSEDVDAVYIALINGLRMSGPRRAAGKHVLCEPLTSNAREHGAEQLARQRSPL